MNNIVVTIARQYGSGGKTIGGMLAKELGINVYNREILKLASEDSGINETLFNQVDERLKKTTLFGIMKREYKGELILLKLPACQILMGKQRNAARIVRCI